MLLTGRTFYNLMKRPLHTEVTVEYRAGNIPWLLLKEFGFDYEQWRAIEEWILICLNNMTEIIEGEHV